MPYRFGSLVLPLLIAMLTTGCTSQNAMSLLPDSVKLDVARDKATKQGPLSVGKMMAMARTLHPDSGKETEQVEKVDDVKAAAVTMHPSKTVDPIQTAYADEGTPKTTYEIENDTSNNILPVSPSELFQQAVRLNQNAQNSEHDPSAADIKTAAVAQKWRKLIDEQVADQWHEEPSVAASVNADIPLVLPIVPVEIIAVSFNETSDSLKKNDDLKLKLLRFGKRMPLQIAIGKITNAEGFEVMQSALALGNIIIGASGGMPAITYNPSIAPGAAQVTYASVEQQS